MVIHRIVTLLFLFILLFIPNQQKEYFRIVGLINLLSLFLLPVFVKNVHQDISHRNPVTIFFILFLIASAVSTFFSIDQKRSVVDLLLYCSYFVIFTSIRSIFQSQKAKELLTSGLLLAVVILSIISLYSTLVLEYVNRTGEGVSFMWIYYGHNHLSALLLFAIPIAFYFLWKKWKNKFLCTILLTVVCFLFFAMFFTFARISLLSLSLSLIIGSFFLPILGFRKSLIASSIGVMLMFFVLPFGINSKAEKLAVPKKKIDIMVQTERSLYWTQAVANFTVNPLFGTGLNTFKRVNYNLTLLQNQTFLRSDYAHNFFLQMLSDAGFFGFLTSLGLIFTVLVRSAQKIFVKSYFPYSNKFLSIAFFVGIFASALNSLVDFDWQMPAVFFVFWIIAGVVLSPSSNK